MKKLLGLIAAFCFIGTAYAADLDQYAPGFRLIDGNQLNKMVDAVNTINSGLATYAGEQALDGSNPTPVTTGLSAISACSVSIKIAVAPTTTTIVTYDRTGGTLNLYGWKSTGVSTTTLISSTGNDVVGWICSGTK